MSDAVNGSDERKLAKDPRYAVFVRERTRFAALLTAATLVVYTGFICLIAFDKPWLSRPINGGHVTIGIAAGLGMIAVAIGICALYVARANRIDDARVERLLLKMDH